MLWICFILLALRLPTASGIDYLWAQGTLAPLHHLCLSYLTWRDLDPIYRGLICGSSQIPPSTEGLFKELGIYHMLVVSGSHFVFLEQCTVWIFKKQRRLQFSLFLLFAVVCQLHPPVVRALLGLLLAQLSQHYRLFWRAEQRVLYSGLVTLIIFPEWLGSPSLLLSWIASLAITLTRKHLAQQGTLFIMLTPMLWQNSPVSLLNNLIVNPIFGGLLFPFTLATTVIPYSTEFANSIWALTLKTLAHLPAADSELSALSSPKIIGIWIYIFASHWGLKLTRGQER